MGTRATSGFRAVLRKGHNRATYRVCMERKACYLQRCSSSNEGELAQSHRFESCRYQLVTSQQQ